MEDNTFSEHQNANRHANESANSAIKGALFINGGAAVSILGFLERFSSEQMPSVSSALLFFSWGVVAAVLTSASSYFTNFFLAEHIGDRSIRSRRLNIGFHILSVLLLILSIVLFLGGVYAVRSALLYFG